MELFREKGVILISLKESIDTNSSTGKLLFTLMSAFAQFERDLISERTIEALRLQGQEEEWEEDQRKMMTKLRRR